MQRGSRIHSSLHYFLPKGKLLPMARLSNMPCPVHLYEDPPALHVHPSNGVFIGVDGDTVYCACSECKLKDVVHGGSLEVLKGTHMHNYAWIVLSGGDVYKTVLERAARRGPAACPVCLIRVYTLYSFVSPVLGL